MEQTSHSEHLKTFTSKKGNKVIFRYPEEGDFAGMWGFACDLASEDTFVTLTNAPTEEEERKWFSDMMEKMRKREGVHVSVYVNGTYAGSGRVDKGKFRHAHVGSIGVALAPAYREEGIGTELMRQLIDEAKKLGLRLLTLSCFENNPRALHVYEKMGFKRSGVTPGAIAFQGTYVGEVHYYLPLVAG